VASTLLDLAESGEEVVVTRHGKSAVRLVAERPVAVADLSAATRYIRRFDTVLRTLDAIHAAIAARENMTLATADVRLAEAATILRISTELVRGE